MTLPPLPEPMWAWKNGPRPYQDSFSDRQMREYAQAAVLAERERMASIMSLKASDLR